jgi:tetratricopeptide (TPR) repeat protein
MLTRTFLPIAMAVLLLTLSVDCPRRSAHREGVAPDDPHAHYLQGQRELIQENYQEAADQFTLAIALDPDFAPAYEGLGLAQLGLGELPQAQRYLHEGLQKDDTYVPLYIGLGRVLSAQGEDQEALGQFQHALALDAGNADAFYHMGRSFVNLGKYSQAEESFKKALDNNPSHARASEEWAILARLRTPPGEPPQEYVGIAKKPVVLRADFAALLAHQLPLQDFCAPGEHDVSLPDVDENWAVAEIQQVVACELMRAYDDGEFKPRQALTRLQCALAIEEVLLKVTGDSQLTQQFDGQSSPYPDVSADHEAFGAIMLATSRGIMDAKADGSFGPDDAINGYAANKIVRALKSQL